MNFWQSLYDDYTDALNCQIPHSIHINKFNYLRWRNNLDLKIYKREIFVYKF
jgi:hypothetical protein